MESSRHEILSHCKKLISHPGYRENYLSGLRHRVRGLCGCFSNYVPAEIIAAAGLHPLRIIGHYESGQAYRKAALNPVCSFVQDMAAAAISDSMAYLDTVIFPNSCDSIKVLRQLWEADKLHPAAYTLAHPVKNDAAAVQYFTAQLRDLAAWLQNKGGRDISLDSLGQTIDSYNQTRNMLRKLYQCRSENPQCVSGADLFTLMTAGLMMDREQYNQMLSRILDETQNQSQNPNPRAKRMMIIGPLLDNIELLEKIESLGAVIIADEVTNGWRYFDLNVETAGDFYENLARRYLFSGPSPTLSTDPAVSLQAFRQRIEGLDVNGVLFINQKFCEPHIHNYLAKSNLLRQINIKCLMLEIEHNRCEVSERDLLRIESFIEVC